MAKVKPAPEPELTTMEIIEQKVARGNEIEEKLLAARLNQIEMTEEEYDVLEAEQAQLKQEIEELVPIMMGDKFIDMIQGKVKLYKPFLPKIEGLLQFLKPEIASVFKTFFNLMIDVGVTLDPEMARLSKLRAKSTKRMFDDFVAAGFSVEQAMQLVVAQLSRPVSMPSLPSVSLSSGR
jgi:hypothetical protein